MKCGRIAKSRRVQCQGLTGLAAALPLKYSRSGTRKVERLEENAAAMVIKLTAAEMEELGGVFGFDGAFGERWTEAHMQHTYHYGSREAVAPI